MQQGGAFQVERRALEGVLASGAFARAPSLVQFLTYVCEMDFAGRSREIKEYSIAVDALGRPRDFDPKRDSIVRVEAHRLRKRLAEYYASSGASDGVRIVIPPGQYVPQFVRTAAEPAPAAPRVPAPEQKPRVATAPTAGRRRFRWPAAIAWFAAALLAGWWLTRMRPDNSVLATVGVPSGPELRLRAGAEMYADPIGRIWLADRVAAGGTLGTVAGPVRGARDPHLYSEYREGTFRYEIPLAQGAYEMRLHFVEPIAAENAGQVFGEGTRLVQVSLNGKTVLRDLDIFAEVGARAACVKAFRDVGPAADGKLRLEFSGSGRGAVVNAIEITPGIPGVTVPIRVVSRETPYTDSLGRSWAPDSFVTGGKLVFRSNRLLAPDDPELYRGERYGALTYRIPVPTGRYTLVLRFAETWFGPGHPGGGGVGSRIFDIQCNGVLLERDFDVFREAGGSDRGLRRVYRGIEPNAQGVIAVVMAPKRNYAEVNAIEVLDEGW